MVVTTVTIQLITLIGFVISNNFKTTSAGTIRSNHDPKILIIGAGPAGIAAASRLLENGMKNVTILEAENRIGGRVYTTQLGNYQVDLGGQWVHGEKGNVAFEIAYPLGVLDKSDDPGHGIRTEYFDSSGVLVNSELSKNITNFYDKYLDDYVDSENKTNYESIGNYVVTKFEEEFSNFPDILKEKKKYLHNLELAAASIDPDESWLNVSASSYEYDEGSGDHLINWKDRGYSTILDILMKRFPDSKNELPVINNTFLKSEVMTIDYSKTDSETPISVNTSDGRSFKADHVILTIPLGALKEKYDSIFMPKLPLEKIETIKSLGFGSVGKVFLLFNEPFWELNTNERIVHHSFLWNDADREQIEADAERMWLLGIVGATTVEHKPNLLELWISGKYVKAMEALPENKVFKHAVENLHRFLDKKFNVTQPIAMLRTQWYTNPHFRGSYSYRTVESHKKRQFAHDLEMPLNLNNLPILFAGEATSSKRYGTVDGAIGSGWKAADRLLNHYGKLDQ